MCYIMDLANISYCCTESHGWAASYRANTSTLRQCVILTKITSKSNVSYSLVRSRLGLCPYSLSTSSLPMNP